MESNISELHGVKACVMGFLPPLEHNSAVVSVLPVSCHFAGTCNRISEIVPLKSFCMGSQKQLSVDLHVNFGTYILIPLRKSYWRLSTIVSKVSIILVLSA